MSKTSTPRRSGSRRLLAVGIVVSLSIAAACSGDSDVLSDADTGNRSDSSQPGVPQTRADGTPVEDPTTTSPAANPPPTGSSNNPPPTATTATTAGGTAGAEVPPAGGPGSYAGLFLRPTPRGSATILVDVFQADGAAPQSGTVNHVRDTLAAVSDKRVDLRQTAIDAPNKSWTADELRALADANGGSSTSGQAVIELLFLHGDFSGDDGVLGVAVRADVAAVFVDKIDEATGLLDSPAAIEKAVTTHEVGHLLGLVDLFLDTGREDPEHPKHSSNRDSVMYWAVESVAVSQLLEGAPPTEFDDADRADLATIRNG